MIKIHSSLYACCWNYVFNYLLFYCDICLLIISVTLKFNNNKLVVLVMFVCLPVHISMPGDDDVSQHAT